MNFEEELQTVLAQIKKANDQTELDYIRRTNEKEYWWTSILILALFYGLNDKIGKMLLYWLISFIGLFFLAIPTLICYVYGIYKSYTDQKEFNDAIEYAIYQRTKELQGNPVKEEPAPETKAIPIESAEEPAALPSGKFCPACGGKVEEGNKFCPNCGEQLIK